MTFDYEHIFKEHINAIKNEGRYREFATLERIKGEFPKAHYYPPNGNRKTVTLWCSNDYLGMGQHEAVIEAMHNALECSGAGAGGTRNISGTTKYIVQLEDSIANLHNKESGLIFSSGYTANQGALAILAKLLPDCIIYSDKKNHASMIHGIKDSQCQKKIFRHNDIEHLENLLKSEPKNRSKIIAFESVYSMDGDIAPIKEICRLAKTYNALTYLDEVHAVGMYGEHGAGYASELGVMDEIDIIEGTFGKAYGVVGGYIAGKRFTIDAVRSFSSNFIFTTGLPPTVLAGAHASVEHLKQSTLERQALHKNVAYLKNRLDQTGMPYLKGPSHIVPLIIGDPNCCKAVSKILMDKYSIYVQPINYPTVPRRTERLRLTTSAVHSKENIDTLCDSLSELYNQHHGFQALAA